MIRNPELASMFVLGIMGTGHCVGMCGPLVLALPARSGRATAHLFYHLGRILTYTLVGALMGGAGATLVSAARATGSGLAGVARVQVGLSVLAAALLLVFGLGRLGILRDPRWLALAAPTRIPGFRRVQRGALTGGGAGSMFLLGLLLGLLPCGLSYAAFARALPAGGPAEGALLVLAFALGTVPGLWVIGTGASGFARRHARLFDIVSGVLLVAMAAKLGVDAAGGLLS